MVDDPVLPVGTSFEDQPALVPWKTLNSKQVFSALPWLEVSVEQIQLPDGRVVDDFYQVWMPESVLIYATTDDGNVVMEQAYRHGIGTASFVFPAGGINPEETAVDAARRELLEETGYSAENWRRIGSYVANSNQGCGKVHLIRAEAARKVAEPGTDDLEEIRVVLMNKDELLKAVTHGDINALSSVMVASQALAGLLDPEIT